MDATNGPAEPLQDVLGVVGIERFARHLLPRGDRLVDVIAQMAVDDAGRDALPVEEDLQGGNLCLRLLGDRDDRLLRFHRPGRLPIALDRREVILRFIREGLILKGKPGNGAAIGHGAGYFSGLAWTVFAVIPVSCFVAVAAIVRGWGRVPVDAARTIAVPWHFCGYHLTISVDDYPAARAVAGDHDFALFQHIIQDAAVGCDEKRVASVWIVDHLGRDHRSALRHQGCNTETSSEKPFHVVTDLLVEHE